MTYSKTLRMPEGWNTQRRFECMCFLLWGFIGLCGSSSRLAWRPPPTPTPPQGVQNVNTIDRATLGQALMSEHQ